MQGYMSIGEGNEIRGYTWMREMRYKIHVDRGNEIQEYMWISGYEI